MPGDQRLGIATFEHRQEVWPASEMRLSDKIQSPDDGDSSKNAQLLLSHNFLKSGRYSFVACVDSSEQSDSGAMLDFATDC